MKSLRQVSSFAVFSSLQLFCSPSAPHSVIFRIRVPVETYSYRRYSQGSGRRFLSSGRSIR